MASSAVRDMLRLRCNPTLRPTVPLFLGGRGTTNQRILYLIYCFIMFFLSQHDKIWIPSLNQQTCFGSKRLSMILLQNVRTFPTSLTWASPSRLSGRPTGNSYFKANHRRRTSKKNVNNTFSIDLPFFKHALGLKNSYEERLERPASTRTYPTETSA